MKFDNYEAEERAAIYEYDAHLSRDKAEQRVIDDARRGEQLCLNQRGSVGTMSTSIAGRTSRSQSDSE